MTTNPPTNTQHLAASECCTACGQPIIKASAIASGQGWRMEQGDCQQLIRKIKDGSVAAIITDPPYGSGGDTVAARMCSSKAKYCQPKSSYQTTLPDIDGEAVRPEEWVARMQTTLKECRRVLTPDGVFAAFIDWRQLAYFQNIVASAGIRIRGMAVWDKVNGRPYRGGFRAQTEYIVWGGVGKLPRQDLYLPGVLRHTTKSNGKMHITEKPLELMRDLVKLCTPGGLILDPFAGSSSTGVAAMLEGYRYHGMESVPGYFDISVERLRSAEQQADPATT